MTTTFEPQYPGPIDVMRNEPPDFIGIDYAADNRQVEEVILLLAQERKIAVLAYAPFGRTRSSGESATARSRAGAAECRRHELGAALPQVCHLAPGDHRGDAGHEPVAAHARQHQWWRGASPDAAMRQRIIEFVDALLPAPPRGR
ncbi:MAG: hypothetical protein IPK33_13625 [Gemmatimonadetes bacterium]|nr:hypothetical protein [Gemmatimonadota bacterium]